MPFRPRLYKPWQIIAATDELAVDNALYFQKYGIIDLLTFPVQYAEELKDDNEYITVEDMLKRGPPYLMDCEDLSGWLKAQLIVGGFLATVWIEQQNARLYHVLNKVLVYDKWMRLDPSRWKGMRGY